MSDTNLGAVAVLAALVLDIGWITWQPAVGVGALVVLMIVQTGVVWDAVAERGPGLADELAFWTWSFAAGCWMIAAFLWDGQEPAGFLNLLPTSSPDLYPGVLMVCGAAIFVICVALTAYLVVWCSMRRTGGAGKKALKDHALEDQARAREPPVFVVMTAWFPPWLFMEAGWSVCDSLIVQKMNVSFVAAPCALAAVMAVVLASDGARCFLAREQRDQAFACMADCCWVLGNLLWFVDDVMLDMTSSPAWYAAVVLFVLGVACVLECLRSQPKEPRSLKEAAGGG